MRVLIFIFLVSATQLKAGTYSINWTNKATEAPLSDGSRWKNGALDGLVWTDMRVTSTNGGRAYISQTSGGSPHLDDSTAILSNGQTWSTNHQSASAVVRIINRPAGAAEIELRLDTVLSNNYCAGYECLWSLKNDSSCYVVPVQWNGALDSFTPGPELTGTQYILQDGDTISANVTNGFVRMYINGTLVNSWNNGNVYGGTPGIGGSSPSGTTNSDYGLTSFSATDGVGPSISSVTIAADGVTITAQLSTTCTNSTGGTAGWTDSMSGGAATWTYSSGLSGIGGSTVTLTSGRTILQGETGTATYTQPGSGIQSFGIDLPTQSGITVVNNSTQTATAATTSFRLNPRIRAAVIGGVP